MATDKPRIQAYIDPALYEHYEDWKKERGIDKDSPALNQILAEYFGVSSQSPIPNPQSLITTEQIEEMIEEACEVRVNEIKADLASKLPTKPEINERIDEYLKQQFEEFNGFRVEFKTEAWLQMKREFAIWNESLQKVSQVLEKRIEALELQAMQPTTQEEAEYNSESPHNSLGDLPEFLNAANLARRLGISKSVISRRKSQSDFEDWTRTKDPAGVGWRFPGKGQRFFLCCDGWRSGGGTIGLDPP